MATTTQAPPTSPAAETPRAEVTSTSVASPTWQVNASEQEVFRGDKVAVILFLVGFVALAFLLLCDLFVNVSR